jgi:hypothetical protein
MHTILDKDNYMCKGNKEYRNYAALTYLADISKWLFVVHLSYFQNIK